MGSGFTLKPRANPVDRLRTSFPDIYDQLLEWADPDTPHLMYFAFAGLLLERQTTPRLWQRAYRFFDELAESGDTRLEDVLSEAFDRLGDSDARDQVDNHLGSAARTLFHRSNLNSGR